MRDPNFIAFLCLFFPWAGLVAAMMVDIAYYIFGKKDDRWKKRFESPPYS